MSVALGYTQDVWEATGPPWFVFRCERDGTPMLVGFTEEEFAYRRCEACGAGLVATRVEAS